MLLAVVCRITKFRYDKLIGLLLDVALTCEAERRARTDITDHVTGQSTNWMIAKYPFDVMIATNKVGRCV